MSIQIVFVACINLVLILCFAVAVYSKYRAMKRSITIPTLIQHQNESGRGPV